MDNGSQHALTLTRLPQGGYVVQDSYGGGGMMCMQHYACSSIDDALQFIRDKVKPIEPQQWQVSDDGDGNMVAKFGEAGSSADLAKVASTIIHGIRTRNKRAKKTKRT